VPIIRHFLFMPFLEQDVEMMESEQHSYQINPERRYVEVNPAIIALQRLIVRQFVQQSIPSESLIEDISSETLVEAKIEQTPENSMR